MSEKLTLKQRFARKFGSAERKAAAAGSKRSNPPDPPEPDRPVESKS